MDGQGSVLAITDGAGNPVTNYQIDAWGNVLSGNAPGNAFDFLGGLGYWADPDLGLHYVRARWMNPQFGSWMSVDPHLDQFAYQYANNMPTTGSDPSGAAPDDDAYWHTINNSLLWHDLHSKTTDVQAHAEAEKKRRTSLGLLPANWHGEIVGPKTGIKAGDPNAKNLKGSIVSPLSANDLAPGQKPGGPASASRLTPEADRTRVNAELAAAVGSYGMPGVMHNGVLHPTPAVKQLGTSGWLRQRETHRVAVQNQAIADMLRQSNLESLHGGAAHTTAHEKAQLASARKVFETVKPVAAPGGFVNSLVPHFDEALAETRGFYGGVAKGAAAILNSAPDAALLLLAPESSLPYIARTGQVLMGAGIAAHLADRKSYKADPGQWWGGLAFDTSVLGLSSVGDLRALESRANSFFNDENAGWHSISRLAPGEASTPAALPVRGTAATEHMPPQLYAPRVAPRGNTFASTINDLRNTRIAIPKTPKVIRSGGDIVVRHHTTIEGIKGIRLGQEPYPSEFIFTTSGGGVGPGVYVEAPIPRFGPLSGEQGPYRFGGSLPKGGGGAFVQFQTPESQLKLDVMTGPGINNGYLITGTTEGLGLRGLDPEYYQRTPFGFWIVRK